MMACIQALFEFGHVNNVKYLICFLVHNLDVEETDIVFVLFVVHEHMYFFQFKQAIHKM